MPPATSTAFRIVINYRRDDTAGHAGRLYDALAARFGHDHVFIDIDAIEPGADFTKVLERAVDSCDAFISLIGRGWLTVKDAQGRRRVDNPGDFVRIEIEAALDRDVRLIPVLVQEAEMPTKDVLPAPLARLAYRNAIELRDTSWRSDVERLVRTLEKLEREKAEELERERAEVLGRAEADELERANTAVLERRTREQVEREPPTPPSPPPGPRVPRRVLVAALGAAGVLALGVLLAVLLVRGGDEGEAAPITTEEGGDGRIVYGDGAQIVAMDADGANRTPIAGPNSGAPEWSPDGTRIAFAQNGRIVVMNADGGGQRPLTSGSPRDNAPAWSSDGAWIAFDREAGDGSWDVIVIDANGRGSERNLTNATGESGAAPDWSPDGTRIVYQRGTPTQIWVMSADGGGKREIAEDLQGGKLSPTWSPDGELIAFAFYPTPGDNRSFLYVMRPDGSAPRPLTQERLFNVNYPAWSADGERLVFTAQGGLWMVPRGGGAVKDVPSGPTVGSPSWAPAG